MQVRIVELRTGTDNVNDAYAVLEDALNAFYEQRMHALPHLAHWLEALPRGHFPVGQAQVTRESGPRGTIAFQVFLHFDTES